ncbi:hypothetical protein Tcan_09417 [Toxocara canis]|uniref:Uncharacterized protein n=1 Tax=Toxocara canis TaxID=6265 RepID=A0A0B2VCI9_TOXCA|nr:hypothetical protein Tcan_09417 [Toxocara canis]
MPHEESASRCIVSLVDYAEVVDCETKMVFDVADQPQIVRDLPAAAFKFRMKNVDGPWEDEEKMPRLHEEETYAVDLQGKGARGVFFGSARFVLQKVSKQPCVSDDEQSAALIFESGYKGEASMMETEDEELRALTEREEGLKLCMELMQEEQDKFCRERRLHEMQTNCWPILNPDLRPPPATTTGNFLPPVGFVELPASYNTTPREIIQQNGSGDGHQRLTSSSVTELPSELSLGYKLVVEPSEDRARPVDMDLLHSQPSRVQISVMQPQLVNYSMEQLRECSLQQSLPPAMHQPNVLLRFCKSLQADLLNNVVQERWNAATETSGCGGILGPSVVHRVPFVVQQQQSCCGLSSQNGAFSQSNVAYFPGDVPHTIPGMNQSACRQPCMSVVAYFPGDVPHTIPGMNHISMEQQDQAYCAARNRWPAESGLRPRVGGMSCPSATGASEITCEYAIELQQTITDLKAQVERLHARCASLEAKASGNCESVLPQENNATRDDGVVDEAVHSPDHACGRFAALMETACDTFDETGREGIRCEGGKFLYAIGKTDGRQWLSRSAVASVMRNERGRDGERCYAGSE